MVATIIVAYLMLSPIGAEVSAGRPEVMELTLLEIRISHAAPAAAGTWDGRADRAWR